MARGNAVMAAQEKKWRIEGDAEALKRAAEIEADPKRSGPAKRLLSKQAEYIDKVCNKKK